MEAQEKHYCKTHPEQPLVQHKTLNYWLCIRCEKNRRKREENATLRELCGTSARAARLDMGL